MSFKDSAEWRQGQWGERQVRRKFEEEGWWVVPVHLIEYEGAPGLTRRLSKAVLPNLQVGGHGEMRWVEVKTKSRAVFYNRLQRWQTGIELRLWQDYLTVCAETGTDGYLALIHLDLRQLLLGRFSWIGIDAQVASDDGTLRSFGEPMIFFAVDRFDRLDIESHGPYAPSDHEPAPEPIPPKVVRPWEEGRTVGPKQELMPW